MEWSTPDALQPTPHCGPKHWEHIWDYAKRANLVLEFGSGGSTWWVATRHAWRRCPRWIAIEHNYEWYKEVWVALEREADVLQVPRVLFASSVDKYAYPPVTDKADVVIVDGKWRDAVLAGIHEYLTDDGVVFLHDAHRRYNVPPTLRVEEQYADETWEQNPRCELAVLVRNR